jgi:RNA polymerase sigma-70 factor (ECF subfamily)
MMSDEVEIIERIRGGDVAAFRVLVERHQGRLFGFLRRFLSRPADCEDVAQEVFLAAFRNLAGYRPASARFSTWLLTIARNKCVNVLQKRRSTMLADLAEPPEPIDERTPDAALAEAEFHRQLDAALDALPLEQKTVFVLAEIQELSLDEVGRIEGVSVGTVKSRLSRARAKLRACFPQTEPT